MGWKRWTRVPHCEEQMKNPVQVEPVVTYDGGYLKSQKGDGFYGDASTSSSSLRGCYFCEDSSPKDNDIQGFRIVRSR